MGALYQWRVLLPAALGCWGLLAVCLRAEAYGDWRVLFAAYLVPGAPVFLLSYAAVYRDEAAGLAAFGAVPSLVLLGTWFRPARLLPDELLPESDEAEDARRVRLRLGAGRAIVGLVLASLPVAAWLIFTERA